MSKPKKEISPSQAIGVLEMMLYKHECNSAFIDFDSDDEEEVEQAEWYNETKQSLQLAIKTLKEKEK